MAKFKNKKTGVIVEENLMFYIKSLHSNPNFEEVIETSPKQKETEKSQTDRR